MIIVRGREGLHFDKHLGLYCRVGIVHKHTQSLQVALCDITQTQLLSALFINTTFPEHFLC